MSSQEATHANHSVPLGSEEVQTTRDTCGPRCLEPLAVYDRESRSWRMSGVITLWGLTVSLETLPTSGMTQSGRLFRRSLWVRHIAGSGSSAWPTPVSSSSMAEDVEMVLERLENGRPYKSRPVEAVALWPTPTAHPDNSNVNGMFQNPTLGDAVRMYPTPIANGMAGGSGAFNKAQSLEDAGQITKEERIAMQAGNGGKLNPMWVEWLMGFPLGWTDLEDSATQ